VVVILVVVVVEERGDPLDPLGAGQAEQVFLPVPSQVDSEEVFGVGGCCVGSGTGRKDISHQLQQFPLKLLRQEQPRDLYDDDARVAVAVAVVVDVDDADVRPWQHRQPVQHRRQQRPLQGDDGDDLVVEDYFVVDVDGAGDLLVLVRRLKLRPLLTRRRVRAVELVEKWGRLLGKLSVTMAWE